MRAIDIVDNKSIPLIGIARDLIALTKPRLTSVVLATTMGGMWIAPNPPSKLVVTMTLLGTALIVAGAHALNMYIERDSDAHMERTRNRPLPAGRLSPKVALVFGVILTAVAIPILAIGANPTTALLALVANLSYVFAYTPMKRRSYLSLWVGAFPGAMPPLLGWTAATGKVDAVGLILFGILFIWQIPHFLAITIFREEEYKRAGLKIMPETKGLRSTKHTAVHWLAAQLGVSLLLVPTGLVGQLYLASAVALGLAFFVWGLWGLRQDAGKRWARSLFAISIPYLVLLFTVAIVDARLF